jgi:hypothetical protein
MQEMVDANAFVDNEAFHLVESMVVRWIWCLLAEDSARGDHSKWSAMLTESPNLHARSMRAHANTFTLTATITLWSNPNRVVRLSRRMVCRNIERIKIVIFELNFGAVGNPEAHGLKNIFEFTGDLPKRMQATGGRLRPRQSGIKPISGKVCCQIEGVKFASSDLDLGSNLLLHTICCLPCSWPIFFWKST